MIELLPNVWVIDGQYISNKDRLSAKDFYEQYPSAIVSILL
jgi:hypothetical protein